MAEPTHEATVHQPNVPPCDWRVWQFPKELEKTASVPFRGWRGKEGLDLLTCTVCSQALC